MVHRYCPWSSHLMSRICRFHSLGWTRTTLNLKSSTIRPSVYVSGIALWSSHATCTRSNQSIYLHCIVSHIGNQKPTSPNTLLRNLRRSPCGLKYEKQNTFMSHLVFAEGFDRTGKDGRLSRYNGDVYDGHVESWLHTWNCQRQRRRSIHATWKCFYNRVPLLKQTEPLPHYKSWYILTIKYLPQLTY